MTSFRASVSTIGNPLAWVYEWPTLRGPPTAAKASLAIFTISCLLAGSWLLAYQMGGMNKAFPHIFYVPILFGAWFFGFPGGVATALAAGVLCGPLMSFGITIQTMQSTTDWLYGISFFVLAGGVAGMMCQGFRMQAKEITNRSRISTFTGLQNQNALELDLDERIRKGGAKDFLLAQIQIENLDDMSTTLGHTIISQLVRSIGLNLSTEFPFPLKVYNDQRVALTVMTGDTPVSDVTRFGEALIDGVQKRIEVSGLPIVTKCHVGFARYPAHGENGAELIRASRFALETAVVNQQKYQIFNKGLDIQARQSVERLMELRQAIGNDELFFHYQPKIDLKTGRTTSVEALVRWNHPREGLLMPGAFIPAAEKTDLVTEISAWGIREAIIHLALWKEEGVDVGIAVNLSARDLVHTGFVETLRNLISLYDIDARRLETEVTETAIISDIDCAERALGEIRKLGVKVSIDDFGTGHSGLSQLRNLPIDSLKIDRLFVSRLLTSPGDDTIVRAAIDLGHRFGVEVVAEGVESDEILCRLRKYGCDFAQGYGIARPMPENDFRRWLDERNAGTGDTPNKLMNKTALG